uniref:hypothetical protein n=1 Tax=Anaplasma centrale TaxID=769 RepID=UPI00165134DB|nr:hypothetical protein [Anaplasma centrale]
MLLKLRFLLIAGVFTWSILHGVPAGAQGGGTAEADDTLNSSSFVFLINLHHPYNGQGCY